SLISYIMKRGLKIWLWAYAVHFIVNVAYWLIMTSPLGRTLRFKFGYMIVMSPLMIFCVDGGGKCIGLTIIISGAIISAIITGLVLMFSKSNKS
ncbi:MAG: hypothetical protein WCP89_02315, partial [archaeon]